MRHGQLNEYYAAFLEAEGDVPFSVKALDARGDLIARYAWAIPNDEAIQQCVRMSPIVEVGAGTGYWAKLITQAGGDVIAYDIANTRRNNCYHNKVAGNDMWFDVRKGDETVLGRHADRTLLLCWPPYATPMAQNCLRQYAGHTLLFVGESRFGCTGDDGFFDLLTTEWDLRKRVDIPQWCGIHDAMFVYTRKVPST